MSATLPQSGSGRVARHPTGIADSTLPSLWSNADFRRANIDTLRRRLHNPLPRGGVAAEQVVSALAVDVIDGLHSTASGRFFAWVIGGALPAALDADWLTAAWDQNAYMLPDLPRRWLRNVNHKQPVVTKDGLDRLRILPKSPLVGAVRFESQDRPES